MTEYKRFTPILLRRFGRQNRLNSDLYPRFARQRHECTTTGFGQGNGLINR